MIGSLTLRAFLCQDSAQYLLSESDSKFQDTLYIRALLLNTTLKMWRTSPFRQNHIEVKLHTAIIGV